MTEVDWAEVGRRVEGERVALGWSKEEAARRAGISSITWKRVEDGLRVQDIKLQAVLRAVGMGLGYRNTDGEHVQQGAVGMSTRPASASGIEETELRSLFDSPSWESQVFDYALKLLPEGAREGAALKALSAIKALLPDPYRSLPNNEVWDRLYFERAAKEEERRVRMQEYTEWLLRREEHLLNETAKQFLDEADDLATGNGRELGPDA